MKVRITTRAKTIKARAHELRFIAKTAQLAIEQGKRLVISVTARKAS
jgi:hypothetical protein